MRLIQTFIASLFRPLITPVKPGPAAINDPVLGIPGATGALPDYGNLAVIAASLSANASPAFGNFSQTLIPASLAAATYSAGQLLGGIIRRFGFAAAATTDSTDTGTNIVNSIPGAVVNQSWLSMVFNLGSNSLVMAAGSGVTITGSNVIAGFSMRLFLGSVLASNSVGFTGIATFPLASSL